MNCFNYIMSLRNNRSALMLNIEMKSSSKQLVNSTGKLQFMIVLLTFACVSYFILTQQSHDQSNGSADTYLELNIQRFNHSEVNEKIVLWSSDFHISPIADIKHMLKDYNVHIIDKSLSGHCHLTNTCETDLRVINKHNGISLEPCANTIRKKFYDSYKHDSEMLTVDAFICTHAASMCELFMPFQKPLIVIASTRYEIGRLDAVSWARWNSNLQAIASHPYNTIAANNRYDQEYIRYFTGIKNIVLLPNFCNYVNTRYSPTRPEILLVPGRGIHTTIQRQLFTALDNYHTNSTTNNNKIRKEILTIVPLRQKYPTYEYPDLASHPAMVVLPYQVSLMSLFEYYRMEIPMFLPSLQLLTTWHLRYHILHERTWSSVYGNPQSTSLLPRHPRLVNDTTVPISDPNDDFSKDSIYEWLALSDLYQWPYIQTFDSWSELFSLLENKELLKKISKQMRQFNVREEGRIKQEWTQILDKIRTYKQLYTEDSRSSSSATTTNIDKGDIVGKHRQSAELPDDINDSLQQVYGYRLSENDCAAQIYTPYSSSSSSSSIGAHLRGGLLP